MNDHCGMGRSHTRSFRLGGLGADTPIDSKLNFQEPCFKRCNEGTQLSSQISHVFDHAISKLRANQRGEGSGSVKLLLQADNVNILVAHVRTKRFKVTRL